MSQTKAKTIQKKEEPIRSKMPLVYLVLGGVLLVVILAAVILLPSLRGDQSSAQKVLDKFYGSLYGAKFDQMPECLPSELQDKFSMASTLGGIGTNVYASYIQQMKEEVGENIEVTTKITSRKNGGASLLNQYQSDFDGVTAVDQIKFELDFKGDKGKAAQVGSVDLVKIGKSWYLSTYNVEVSKKG